jgi:hypothetical protein
LALLSRYNREAVYIDAAVEGAVRDGNAHKPEKRIIFFQVYYIQAPPVRGTISV